MNKVTDTDILNKPRKVSRNKRRAAIDVGLTDPKKVIGSALHGINFLNTGINASNNTDLQGITFFTRPYLNLKDSNVRANRKLASLMTSTPHSINYAIRRLLDTKMLSDNSGEVNNTSLMDMEQPFIPVFTNLLTGMTGWPDETMDMYVSTPGLRNEVYMLVDHLPKKYSSYDLTATFRNLDSDPINAILNVWLTYAKGVSIGELMPYPEMIANRIIDYNTRIYRLVLDTSRRWIHKIACCGASVPTANPIGTAFNFTSETPTISDTLQQSVPFKTIGYCYNDPIVLEDFNLTVERFNRKMRIENIEEKMVKIPPPLFTYFNYRCYPKISNNMELEWWCDQDRFKNTAAIMDLDVDIDYCKNWFETDMEKKNVA